LMAAAVACSPPLDILRRILPSSRGTSPLPRPSSP
jgi:hypothetical protein